MLCAGLTSSTSAFSCSEIIEYSSPTETASCNLASIALPRFVVSLADGGPGQKWTKPYGSLLARTRRFDFDKLAEVTRVVTKNLNRVIDINFYPTESARVSNLRHRPIGIGVQGLADVFILLGLPFESPEAAQINKEIFETIYFAALDASCALAEQLGTYDSYEGCPVSKGILQHDMWGVEPSTDRWDWAALRERIARHGIRNSLLVAPMPTASTAQILSNNEACEPYTSNIYTRRVLSGEFTVVNAHLLHDLIRLDLYTPSLKNRLIAANGSVQGLTEIPRELRDVYKNVWEIKQRALVDLGADRGAFICQSQSLNVFLAAPTFAKLTSLHFYTWERGQKISCYYMRSKAAADAIKFTVCQTALKADQEKSDAEALACSLANPEACMACGS